MKSPSQIDVLGRLRRYQHLLILGGASVITVLVLAAGALQIGASVRAYVADMQEDVSGDVRHTLDFIARATSNLRSNVQQVEQAWAAAGPADMNRVQEFSREGIRKVAPVPDMPPVLVLDRETGQASIASWSYMRLAEQMAEAVAIIADRNAGELTAYLYSPDRRFLVMSVVPWQGADWLNQVKTHREDVFRAVRVPGDDQLLAAGVARRASGTATPTFQWLPARTSPLTGKEVIPVTTTVFRRDGQPFGVLVFELPLETFRATLPSGNIAGACLVLGPDGALEFTCQAKNAAEADRATVALAGAAVAGGLGRSARAAYQDGVLMSAWPMGATGWTLVQTLSWKAIAAGVRYQAIAAALASIVIIIMTWVLMLLVKWKVFVPAVAQSQRVFESEQLSRTLVETAPAGLGLIDLASGEPLLCSPSMLQTADRVAQDASRLPAAFATHYRRNERALPPGSPHMNAGFTFGTRDGSRVELEADMARARYLGRDVLVAAFVDVTLKKRVQEELENARHAADSANAAKSAFLAAMSHEIRTPLNAILGNLELLSHSSLNAAQRNRLNTIRSSSDGLLSIISDVLDFSKIEAGELRLEQLDFDVLEVASRALMIFAPVARAKGLTLQGDLGLTATLPMKGDPTRLAQILHNLLSNAIKFTASGQVGVRVATELGGTQLMVAVEDTGIGMTPEQRQQLFTAFTQADASISRRFGGTGLGLALCSRLTQAMGGTLTVDSEADHGSSFVLRLPIGQDAAARDLPQFGGETVVLLAAFAPDRAYIAQALSSWGLHALVYGHPAQIPQDELENADALIVWGDRQTWHVRDEDPLIEHSAWVIDCCADGPRLPEATGRRLRATIFGLGSLATALRHALQGLALEMPQQARDVLARPLRVLVAEDNPVNQRLIEEQLELLGCDAYVTSSAQDALLLLGKQGFDILLTDLGMPVMDGYELARRTQRLYPATPVVAITAHVTPHERELCEQAGMVRTLTKPLSLEELGQVLSEVTGVERLRVDAAPDGGLLDGAEVPEELAAIFVESGLKSLQALKHARQAADAPAILAELHALRGAFSVFQMDAMARQGQALEACVRDAGVGASDLRLEIFCDALDAVLAVMARTSTLARG